MGDESRQPSWNEILDAATGSSLRGVHTAMLGKIRSYDADAQTASVELAVKLPSASGLYEQVAPVEGPVLWPGSWSAGDRCLVVFLEESASKWLETSSVEEPDVQMRHGLHPVVLPFPSIEGQTVQFVALANLVTDALTALMTAITAAATTETSASGLGGMSALATNLGAPPWPPGVAASKVKAR